MLAEYGENFLKQCGLTTRSSFKRIKNRLVWGTYGKPRQSKFKWVRLIDCSTEHLMAILTTQPQIPSITVMVINAILNDREYK